MRCRRLSDLTALCLLSLTMAACAVNVAQVRREWGAEVVRSDPDRAVLVDLFPPDATSPDSVVIALPIRPGDLTRDAGSRYFGPCLQAWWLSAADRAWILDSADFSVPTGFTARGTPSVPTSPTVNPDSSPERPRISLPRMGDPPPLLTEVGELDGALLLEVHVVDDPTDRCNFRDVSRTRQFLIDLGSVRPVGGTAMGAGAILLGAIALTGLITMVVP